MSRAPTLTWGALVLLAISGFLNYFDRANLSVGAAQIQGELSLTSYQLGLLLSAFFWSYALMQLFLVAGWLVDRFNVCWILAAGFFLWSGATAVTGASRTFAMMFGLRLVLGVGESIAYPSYSRILANYFPEHRRGIANAMIDAGTKLGPAMGTLLGGWLMEIYGWRAFFVGLGAGSLLWLIPWMVWMPRGLPSRGPSQGTGRETHHEALHEALHDALHESAAMPSTRQILRHRAAIASALGLFCSNYFWYFLLTWLPYYLQKARHFEVSKMATTAAAAYFTIAVSTMIAGHLSDRWIARGVSANKVRKSFAGIGLAFSTIILPVAIVDDANTATALLLIACFSFGLYTANVFAITQTLAGPRAAGKWTSLQNGFANLAGVTAPWLTGFIVQQTGEYFWAFAVAAAVVLTGAGIFVFAIGRLEPVKWSGVSFPEALDA